MLEGIQLSVVSIRALAAVLILFAVLLDPYLRLYPALSEKYTVAQLQEQCIPALVFKQRTGHLDTAFALPAVLRQGMAANLTGTCFSWCRLPLMCIAESSQLRYIWNFPAFAYPLGECSLAVFEAQKSPYLDPFSDSDIKHFATPCSAQADAAMRTCELELRVVRDYSVAYEQPADISSESLRRIDQVLQTLVWHPANEIYLHRAMSQVQAGEAMSESASSHLRDLLWLFRQQQVSTNVLLCQ